MSCQDSKEMIGAKNVCTVFSTTSKKVIKDPPIKYFRLHFLGWKGTFIHIKDLRKFSPYFSAYFFGGRGTFIHITKTFENILHFWGRNPFIHIKIISHFWSKMAKIFSRFARFSVFTSNLPCNPRVGLRGSGGDCMERILLFGCHDCMALGISHAIHCISLNYAD